MLPIYLVSTETLENRSALDLSWPCSASFRPVRFSLHPKHYKGTSAGWLGYLCNVRVGRIELPSRPWQGRILPLNHTRKLSTDILYIFFIFLEEAFFDYKLLIYIQTACVFIIIRQTGELAKVLARQISFIYLAKINI